MARIPKKKRRETRRRAQASATNQRRRTVQREGEEGRAAKAGGQVPVERGRGEKTRNETQLQGDDAGPREDVQAGGEEHEGEAGALAGRQELRMTDTTSDNAPPPPAPRICLRRRSSAGNVAAGVRALSRFASV